MFTGLCSFLMALGITTRDVGATTVAGTSQTYPSDNLFFRHAVQRSMDLSSTRSHSLFLECAPSESGPGGRRRWWRRYVFGRGGQGAIYTIPVTPESSIAIYVGVGGSGGTGGGVSAVDVGSLYVETPGGDGGSGSHGTAVNGGTTLEMSGCSCAMARMAPPVPAESPGCSIVSSNYVGILRHRGTNAGPSTTGEGGIVVLSGFVWSNLGHDFVERSGGRAFVRHPSGEQFGTESAISRSVSRRR